MILVLFETKQGPNPRRDPPADVGPRRDPPAGGLGPGSGRSLLVVGSIRSTRWDRALSVCHLDASLCFFSIASSCLVAKI